MSDNLVGGAAALMAVVLVASLPDVSEPGIIALLAGVGALIGTAIGRCRRRKRERVREIAENWTFAGGLVGVGVYLIANAAGVP